MRHRIGGASHTGLGNPNNERLNNCGNLTKPIKSMMREAIKLYFPKYEYCDFDIEEGRIEFGIEPAYMYDREKIICIDRDKDRSWISDGKAWGAYGTDVVRTTRYYRDYKNKCKFTRFIDKWHKKIYK